MVLHVQRMHLQRMRAGLRRYCPGLLPSCKQGAAAGAGTLSLVTCMQVEEEVVEAARSGALLNLKLILSLKLIR